MPPFIGLCSEIRSNNRRILMATQKEGEQKSRLLNIIVQRISRAVATLVLDAKYFAGRNMPLRLSLPQDSL